MKIVALLLLSFTPLSLLAADVTTSAAGEYAKHFAALGKLSVAVAQAMPEDQYGFKPHPDSMDFGQLVAHIATTNYQFCAGLKDTEPPPLPSMAVKNPPPSSSMAGVNAGMNKNAIVKFLSDSFDYCAAIIPSLSTAQLDAPHDSPDGRLFGREVLLAMYVHVAHHRGQAEIYLRDKGIKPPPYMI